MDTIGTPPEHAGTVVGERYELVRPLGRGSFGHTFLAHDRTSGRSVSVKVLDPRGDADWKAYELFEREAAVLRSLRHQGVPEVYDLVEGAWQGAPAQFLVMEYVEGTSIAQLIEAQQQLEPLGGGRPGADPLHPRAGLRQRDHQLRLGRRPAGGAPPRDGATDAMLLPSTGRGRGRLLPLRQGRVPRVPPGGRPGAALRELPRGSRRATREDIPVAACRRGGCGGAGAPEAAVGGDDRARVRRPGLPGDGGRHLPHLGEPGASPALLLMSALGGVMYGYVAWGIYWGIPPIWSWAWRSIRRLGGAGKGTSVSLDVNGVMIVLFALYIFLVWIPILGGMAYGVLGGGVHEYLRHRRLAGETATAPGAAIALQ